MKKLLSFAMLLLLSVPCFADGPYPEASPKPKAKKVKTAPKTDPLCVDVPKVRNQTQCSALLEENCWMCIRWSPNNACCYEWDWSVPAPPEPQVVEVPVPVPVPTPVPSPLPDLVTYSVTGTVTGVATGDEIGAVPGIRLGARGPVAGSPFDMWATLQLTGSPGTTVDLRDVTTFKDAAFDAALGWKLAERRRGTQRVRTYLALSGGFSTRMPADPDPLEQYLRRVVLALRIEDVTHGAWLSLGYGRDDVAERSPWQQVVWEGELPVYDGTIDVILGGRAVLTVFDRDGAHDTFTAYVGGRWRKQ